ncbi:HtaA domain-containing protein [Corynebacterium diphtheriae]|uniref:HtaA domain-containing protein n=1 Tax=Corynebacterium diphtheriae TaxID=1717 RepID=UPI000AD90139|nr:HtaA domain-containing protein [Corynebacterium diphtheriae]CAB0636253.1 hypothetical protein CIP107567_00609 [Corynebacterium diphtheriae]
MVQVIESGTLKWGVKQSYRQYIFNKKLANGNWKIAGDIKEVGEKRGKDFYFEVPVDPESVRLFVCGGLGLQVVRESVGVSHG